MTAGFIRRIGDTQVDGRVSYSFIGEPGALLEDWGPRLEVRTFYDHEEFWRGRTYQEAQVEIGLDTSLRGANGFNVAFQNGYFGFDSDDFAGYETLGPGGSYETLDTPAPIGGLSGVQLFGRFRPTSWLSIRGRSRYGEVPIYAEGSRGVELQISPTAELRFPFGLLADASLTLSRINRARGGRFSLAQIPRLKVQYQFSRALLVRGILQYNLQERDALRSPDGTPLRIDGELSEPVDAGELRYDFLISYEPSPGTIVYAGWSRLLEGPETYRYSQLSPVNEGLFLKVSYLFRL